MKFRPCIDIHNGKVKQIVGGSLKDEGNQAITNFASEYGADFYAEKYKADGLKGGHIILLNSKESEYYEATKGQALLALRAYPNGLQIGGGITAENAAEYIKAGASHLIVTSYVFKDGDANLNMSRAQGINTNFNKILGLMLSNGLVAFSGALLAQYQGFADVNMGRGAIVIGLAAVIIGEAVFGKIFKNFALKLISVVFGSVIYYIVVQAVITLGLDANLLKLLSAMIVAIFLAIPFWKSKMPRRAM